MEGRANNPRPKVMDLMVNFFFWGGVGGVDKYYGRCFYIYGTEESRNASEN